MAHIKMEAALDVSSKWQATDLSLLRWRQKLRRTADECNAALHRWKLQALEEEAASERLEQAPFQRRVAHAVVSFVRALLALTCGNDEVSCACAAVQRFERLAKGSAVFLRCVEFSNASEVLLGDASYSPLQGARHSFLGILDSVEEHKPCCSGYGDPRASAINCCWYENIELKQEPRSPFSVKYMSDSQLQTSFHLVSAFRLQI